METFGSDYLDLCEWVGSKVMTCFGRSNGEHLRGVRALLFFK